MAATIGYVNVIKRSGKEGSRFPVTEDCLIGSGLHCEIRIHLADVAVEHCLIQCQEGGKCSLKNLCKHMPTKLNGTDVTEVAILHHGDTISVSDRLFRWEYEELPQISSVMKQTVALLPRNVTDDMGSSKRLVAVVSPQIRDRQETSHSLRTWVLRRSVGNSLSSRTRHPAKTLEGRRSTSVVKFGPQDSDQSAVSDEKTPRLVNVSRRTSVTSSVKKSLLKVTPHVRKSGGASTVQPISFETPHTVTSVMSDSVSDLVETPVSKTSRVKRSSISYSVTPRSRKSVQMGRHSHSVPSLKKTPNAEETVAVSSPRRSYRKDPLEVSSSVKSANATPDRQFIGGETPGVSQVEIGAQDSYQSAVLDNKTPHSVNVSRRTSIKSSVKKSLLKVTPNTRKSGGAEPIACETPRTFNSDMRDSVSDSVGTPVSKTSRVKKSSISYSVTPRSRKSVQIGRLSHSVPSLKKDPTAEETVAVSSPRKSYRKETLGVSSSVKYANATPDGKFIGGETPDFSQVQSLGKRSQRYSQKVPAEGTSANIVQSPDLFSSDQMPSNGEVAQLKELQKSSASAMAERPKRKSAGLLLAHIRESQELFSRSRRNSTPSANTDKINTRSARASMIVPKKSKLSFTPISQSKTPRKLKSLRAMSAKAAKRRLTDVDLSEIAANKLKAKSPKTPDKKKMAALLQCHKPRMLFSEVVKKTPVKKNIVAKLPTVPISRRRKVLKKPKVHTPRKASVKGINSTGHVDSPETIIIHGKQSMALKRSIQKIKEESESQKITAAAPMFEDTKDVETSVSAKESSREMNTRKSVSFSPAPQVVAFAASRRISTRKSMKIPNITEENCGMLSPNESNLLETVPNRKTSILKKSSSVETRTELMEIDNNSSAVTNLESVRNSSVVSSTPVRVSERQKGRTPSQSPSTPKMKVTMEKSSKCVSVTNQSPEALNTSIVSQASSTFDFDAVTTPCISVEKLVSPLNTTSSKKQINSNSAKRNVNISAQKIFKDLVADKVIDSSKWHYHDTNAAASATDASNWTGSESLAMSSSRKSDRRSVSFPVNRYSTRKSQGKRSLEEVYASSNTTASELNQHDVASPSKKRKVSVNTQEESFISKDAGGFLVNKLEQLPGVAVASSPKLDRNSGRVHRLSHQPVIVDSNDIEGAKKDLRSFKKSLPDDALLSKGYVKQQSPSVRQRKSTINDLRDVTGVRRLFDTTKKQGSPANDLTDVRGVKRLLKTPKQQKLPTNDLTDVRGVKQLLKTPRTQKSPRNDLTDVRGVKNLLRSPLNRQKSPQNDLTDVRGVKKLFRSSKKQISPKNDLTDVRGVKKLLRSPRQQKSPQNDLTDVRGVKRLLQSPRQQKSPQNDLTDVRGVKRLLQSPGQQKSPQNDLTGVEGVKRLVEPESHKNTNPPRTRRGKVQVTGGDTMVSDEKQQKSETTENLEQRDLLIMSTAGHTSPNVKNLPQTRRTRKQAVAKEMVNSNVQASTESTSSPRTLRGKKVTVSKSSEEVKSQSVVETDISVEVCEQNDLFVHPTKLASLDAASSPRTRRGRKQIVNNKKVEVELEQFRDVLQKDEEDVLIKTSQLVSTVAVSPLKTRRGKKYIEKSKEQDEDLKSVSHSTKLKPEVETHKLTQNQQEMQCVNDDETASLKIRGGNRDVSKQQRNKAVTTLSGNNSTESRESDTLSPKPRQKRVIFADVLHASSPSNSPSPRTRRAKKQVVNEESDKKGGLKAGDQLSDECDKPVGKRHQRKLVNADSVECSPSAISGQAKTRKGRKFHTATVTEELKLPFKTPSPRNYKTDGTTAIAESEQSKVSDSVFIESNTISPLKPRRGRKAGTVTVSSTAHMRERSEINSSLDKNIATSVAHTLDTGLADNSTCEVPVVASSKRTLRGKNENVTQVATVPSSDTSETEERKSVKSTRAGRKRAVNLENGSSAVSIQIGSSKDTAVIDSPPPKRSRRVRIRGDMEEGKPSSRSELIELNSTQTETGSTEDSIEKRLHGVTHKTRQTTVSDATKIVDQPDEASEERTSSRRRGVRQPKKETNKNELGNGQSTVEAEQRSTRSKRNHVQETGERSPRKKKNTQSDRLLDVSSEPRVVSPRATRQRRNRRT